MMPIENTEERFGAVAILFHWSMAVLIIGLLALGLYMVRLPDAGFDTRKIVLILYHKEIGFAVLVLLPARLAWRLTQILPQLVADLPQWQKIAARFVHLCFYAMMFALPVTGWLMSSAAGIPVSFFGLFMLPGFLPRDDYLFQRLIDIHKWLAYVLILLIFVHVGAALMHHFVRKDDTLRRMLP
ncbi:MULTISPECIES: cytochrome b [Paraburkholderia]|uniref:Cytochrome b n=1 Tax=Paraburkholderia podalyriae TaxID=1938811 RepID=A0ABR7PVX8_9BURK|nr:cytochrome b [Paraburkholderia podalyriae]MBC8750434.1 cytochrome b [Paraburkholderia podalyriae]